MSEDCNFEISFSDITILESGGKFELVKDIMEKDSIANNKWMLQSYATVQYAEGFADFELHFFYDKNIYIADYQPSIKDVFYNLDLSYLLVWAQENGWNIPKITTDLVKLNEKYWKYFWSVNLIDSDYLDNVYGDKNKVNIDFEKQQ